VPATRLHPGDQARSDSCARPNGAVMCNAWNHPPDCTCGWGGEGHLGISVGNWSLGGSGGGYGDGRAPRSRLRRGPGGGRIGASDGTERPRLWILCQLGKVRAQMEQCLNFLWPLTALFRSSLSRAIIWCATPLWRTRSKVEAV